MLISSAICVSWVCWSNRTEQWLHVRLSVSVLFCFNQNTFAKQNLYFYCTYVCVYIYRSNLFAGS